MSDLERRKDFVSDLEDQQYEKVLKRRRKDFERKQLEEDQRYEKVLRKRRKDFEREQLEEDQRYKRVLMKRRRDFEKKSRQFTVS